MSIFGETAILADNVLKQMRKNETGKDHYSTLYNSLMPPHRPAEVAALCVSSPFVCELTLWYVGAATADSLVDPCAKINEAPQVVWKTINHLDYMMLF